MMEVAALALPFGGVGVVLVCVCVCVSFCVYVLVRFFFEIPACLR